jgi:alpha-tubulin suppressor-like RCC1 family protein
VSPTIIKDLLHERIKDITCGFYHSLFLSESGYLYSTGKNNNGQCGLGVETYNIMSPTRVDPYVFNDERIIYVGAGYYSSFVITGKYFLIFY